MKYKIGLIFSKKDYLYNIEKYGKDYNLLFITGMVGAGKSTISKEISSKYNATILSQDWLAWSEVYKDDKLAMKILDDFYQIYPEAEIAAKDNLWHKDMLSDEQRKRIRNEYNNFLINYSLKDRENLYIIEGIDVYKAINFKDIKDRGLVVKGSSVIKSFIRRYKRDKTLDNQKNIKSKIKYFNMVVKESKIYYFRDRKILNNLISHINKWYE